MVIVVAGEVDHAGLPGSEVGHCSDVNHCKRKLSEPQVDCQVPEWATAPPDGCQTVANASALLTRNCW